MADRPVLVGGPLDGATLSPRARLPFVYCSLAERINGQERARAFARPGTARYLYREAEAGAFVYAGHTHRQCAGCGAFLTAGAGNCALCDHASTSAV